MQTHQKTINIARNFSTEPYGRYPEDGDSNGTKFREEMLLPALAASEEIAIILDGVEGYGSSFLEEAFGGLVRVHGYKAEEIRKRVKIISEEDPSLITEIWSYVDSATPKK